MDARFKKTAEVMDELHKTIKGLIPDVLPINIDEYFIMYIATTSYFCTQYKNGGHTPSKDIAYLSSAIKAIDKVINLFNVEECHMSPLVWQYLIGKWRTLHTEQQYNADDAQVLIAALNIHKQVLEEGVEVFKNSKDDGVANYTGQRNYLLNLLAKELIQKHNYPTEKARLNSALTLVALGLEVPGMNNNVDEEDRRRILIDIMSQDKLNSVSFS